MYWFQYGMEIIIKDKEHTWGIRSRLAIVDVLKTFAIFRRLFAWVGNLETRWRLWWCVLWMLRLVTFTNFGEGTWKKLEKTLNYKKIHKQVQSRGFEGDANCRYFINGWYWNILKFWYIFFSVSTFCHQTIRINK